MHTVAETDIGQKTKESLLWNVSLPAVFQVIRFIVSVVIANLLNPRDFGIMGIASVVVFYSNSLSNLGLSTSLLKEEKINDRDINSVFTLNLGISLLLTLGLCLLSKQLAAYFNMPELRWVLIVFSSIFLTTSFYTIAVALHNRALNFRIVSKIELWRALLQSVVTLALAYMGFSYWALAIGTILSSAVGSVLIMRSLGWKPRLAYCHSRVKEFFGFGLNNFFSVQLRAFGDYVDKLIVGKMFGAVSLGYYEKAFTLSYVPVETFSNRIGSVMFSAFARYQGNKIKLNDYMRKIVIITSAICFPIFLGLFACSAHFVIVLLGKKWEPMIGPLRIMLIAFLLSCIANIVYVLNISAGNYREQTRIRLYSLIFFIIACLVSVRYNLILVAVAVLLYNLIFLLLSWRLASRLVSISLYSFLSWIFPALLGSCIMLAIVYPLATYGMADLTYYNLFGLVAVGAAIYISCMYFLNVKEYRFLRNEVHDRLRQAASSLRSRWGH
jgi:O-antigen/teichoic acid export membrane protein